MKELIRISPQSIGNTTTPTCSARELHQFLEVKTKFYDWITRRIDDYGYKKGKDFNIVRVSELNSDLSLTSSKEKESLGGRPAEDYILTIEMAKELAMVEKTGKGRLIRQYFIHHTNRSEELIPEMAAAMLRRNPLWQKIKRYKGLGLPMADIAKLVQRGVSTVRRHVREMERYGLLIPPVNLGRMQAMARQLRLPGMEVA